MTSLTDEMIEGVEMKVGRRLLVIPALNFRSLKRLAPQLGVLAAIDQGSTAAITDEQYAAMLDVVHAAILRNYPNMSREQLEEDFDLGNAAKIVRAVMTGSGLTQSGEGKPAAS